MDVFESRVRTKGIGASIHQSHRESRKLGLPGDGECQLVELGFAVTAEDEDTVLLCELRAEKGEAWFDLSSLRLKRKELPSAPPRPSR